MPSAPALHKDRLDLLSQAIQLCQSLASVLQALGPKDPLDVRDGGECQDATQADQQQRQQQIYCMEETLFQEFRLVLEARNTLAPISRLTDDILRLIFLANRAEDTADTDYHEALHGLCLHSHIISSVCRHWRAVALQTAPLWSYAIMTAPKVLRLNEERSHPWHETNAQPVLTKKYDLSLTRSAHALLTVCIELDNSQCLQILVDMFTRVCGGRVKDLTISWSILTPDHIQFLRDCIHGNQETLTRLRIIGTSQDDNSIGDSELMDVFQTVSEQLCEVSFSRLHYPSAATFALFATCRILHIAVSPSSNFSFDIFRLILQTSAQLEDLTLELLELLDEDHLNIPPQFERMDLLILKSLRVHQTCDMSFPFHLLTAPNLKRLGIWNYQDDIPSDVASASGVAIHHMLDLSGCRLDHFSSFYLHFNFVRPILSKIAPSIRHLELDFVMDDSYGSPLPQYLDLFDLLRVWQGQSTFPLLESLDFGAQATPIYLSELRDLFERRRDLNFPVKRVQLRGWAGEQAMRPSSEAAYAFEGKVAYLVESFLVGTWSFNKQERIWEKKVPSFVDVWHHSVGFSHTSP